MNILHKRLSSGGRIIAAILAVLVAALFNLPDHAIAQTYPAKVIRVIVPYPPGGTSDILTRLLGAKLAEAWGQQVIADNRTGAGGNIGAELTARAAPDGYTLMLTDIGNLVTSSILYSKLPFDVLKDFAPVTTISYSPHLLAVHPSVPSKTTKELVALAKANPGKLNYAAGLGGTPHLAGLMFAQRTGINWVYIPTKGGAATSYAVATGDADVLFLGILQVLPHINTGKLKLIAASSEQRLSNLPDTPTVAETVPGFRYRIVAGHTRAGAHAARGDRQTQCRSSARTQVTGRERRTGVTRHHAACQQRAGYRPLACQRKRAVGESRERQWIQTGMMGPQI